MTLWLYPKKYYVLGSSIKIFRDKMELTSKITWDG